MQNINMAQFCQSLLENSHGLYTVKTDNIRNPYDIVKNIMAGGNEFYSRACNLQKMNDPSSTVVVTDVPAFPNFLPFENKIVVLLCKEGIGCEPQTILTYHDFEKLYPILDYGMKFWSGNNKDVEKRFRHNIYTGHRLFRVNNDQMLQFCKELSEFSNREYIPLDSRTIQGFEPKSRMFKVPPLFEEKNIPARSCQLKKSNEPDKEIFLTSMPFQDFAEATTNGLAILACMPIECWLETILILSDVHKKFPIDNIQQQTQVPNLNISSRSSPLKRPSNANIAAARTSSSPAQANQQGTPPTMVSDVGYVASSSAAPSQRSSPGPATENRVDLPGPSTSQLYTGVRNNTTASQPIPLPAPMNANPTFVMIPTPTYSSPPQRPPHDDEPPVKKLRAEASTAEPDSPTPFPSETPNVQQEMETASTAAMVADQYGSYLNSVDAPENNPQMEGNPYFDRMYSFRGLVNPDLVDVDNDDKGAEEDFPQDGLWD